MKNAHIKRIVSFLIILLLISSKANAEQLSIADCSFEVKFLLSPEKVLTSENQKSLFQYVWCGDQITSIQSDAFADCPNLQYIRLPEEKTEIAEDAFPSGRKLCFIGVPGGYADVYANEHNYGFMPE